MAKAVIESRSLKRRELVKRTYQGFKKGDTRKCDNPTETYANVNFGYVYREQYVPEHRPKPTDLLSAMTSRPTIRRYITYGTLSSRVYPYMPCNEEYFHRYSAGFPGTQPTVDWATRARLQVSKEALNLAQSVFEYRQTCDMFATAATLADDLYEQSVTKNKRYRRKLTVANVAQANLYGSFGLVPALSDLGSSLDLLNARLNTSAVLVRRHTGLAKESTRGVHNPGTGLVSWSWDVSKRWSIYVGYATDPRRFSMGNPASLAWELIPWSWLVDGLVNVGDYLASLDALTGVQWLKGSVTTKQMLRYRSSATAASGDRVIIGGNHMEQRYGREVVTTIPLGRPTWVASSSWNKVVNAVSALVAQRSTPRYVQFDWKERAPKPVRNQLRGFFKLFRS